ncbi:MAG: hypothetical protein ACLTJG_00745 [[Clostridium] innocuum]
MRRYGDALPHAANALFQVVSALRRPANGGHVCDATLRSSALLIVLQLIGGGTDPLRASQTVSHLCAMQGIWWNIESQLRFGNVIRSLKSTVLIKGGYQSYRAFAMGLCSTVFLFVSSELYPVLLWSSTCIQHV